MSEVKKNQQYEVLKVDERLGIVFGFASITKFRNADGEYEPYEDLQGDIILDEAVEKCAFRFADVMVAKDMHQDELEGRVVFQFPLTESIAKSMGIESQFLGHMIGFEPKDDEILQKFISGERTGFSIGGKALDMEIIDG